MNKFLFLFDLCPLQFPVKSLQQYEKTVADHLGLNYVTERILASVLPNRALATTIHSHQPKHQRDNEFSSNGRPHTGNVSIDELPQDIYEQELISMLEQKHGKVYNMQIFFFYFFPSFLSTFERFVSFLAKYSIKMPSINLRN